VTLIDANEQLELAVEVRRAPSPKIRGPLSEVSDLAAGTAAEHLVCADLLLVGYLAFLADQNCPYDVAVDLGARLVRVQVKSTRNLRRIPRGEQLLAPVYSFTVKRAKGAKRRYAPGEFDVLALVALDIRTIAYLGPSQHRQLVHIKPPGTQGGKQFKEFPFDAAIREVLSA